jgi:drug/metabolite transporter (DMT)-like permease
MLWSSLTEPLINRSYRWSVGELLMGLVMVGAVWLIYHFEFKHWWGFTVGIASAMLGGVFAVINKQLTPYQPPITICFYQMIGACAGCAVLLPVMGSGKIGQISMSDLLWLLALSQICTVGAYIAYLDLLRCMSVFTINVVYNLEPVYGIILAALIFGERERMSGGFYVGASVIIIAVLTMPFINRHRNPAAEAPQVN